MSIKKNFAYSFVLTASGYIFPLLTYPYVSRILGVSGIGICNFIDSIVNYFILFSMMGISTVGIREISQHRDNQMEMSRHFTGLLLLNLISTILAIVALLISMYTIEALFLYRDLLYIGVCKLFFNFFLIEWFYAGVEDFKYITNRSIIVRTIYVILIFAFIKDSGDYKLYYFLTVSTYILNGIINIFYCRKYVSLTFGDIHIRPYIAPFLTTGLYMLITNVYTSFNVTWLGFAAGTIEVGYYSTATKLYTIILALFTALTNVIFPRVTYLYAKGLQDEFWEKIHKVVEVVFAISIPIVITLAIYSSNLIHLLAGNGYEGAYIPFRIIAPIVFLVGYEQVLVIHILMATKHDKQIMRNSIYGAFITILLNILIVSKWGAIGTAIVWLITEATITLLSLKEIYKYTSYRFPFKFLIKTLAFNLPLFIVLYVLKIALPFPDIILLPIIGIIVFSYLIFIQVKYIKNENFIQALTKLRNLPIVH